MKFVPVTVTTVPGPPAVGVKLAMVGTGTVTVKVTAAEAPPPGAGLVTVTGKLPAVATALAGTWAVSRVADTKVAVRVAPLNRTTEPVPKPVPFTVRLNVALPATAVAGARLLMVGAGLGAM
jgi:hypothetical protein